MAMAGRDICGSAITGSGKVYSYKGYLFDSILHSQNYLILMFLELLVPSFQTAAFALPTLERLLYRPKNRPAIRVLILTPTRELAVQ